MTQLRATEGLADRVYRELLALIIQGDLQEGDRLSTEQAIADQFKTSRPTVREALSRLRADGIIASRQGAGTFVTRRPDPDLPRFMPLESLSDVRRCLEFRIVIEGGAAALAAEMADEADLAQIQAELALLQTAVSQNSLGVQEDFGFHLAIARASKNQFFSLSLPVSSPMVFGMDLLRRFSLSKSHERLIGVQAEHVAVVEAILQRDSTAAEAAMRRHLENTRRRMFGS
ncbi:MAG: FadR family transcriptional regulator [Betaproteobacteria bacterium]|nr:FadR family transcriptional regulator [Betaproteobacteria bacterium]